MTTRKEFRKFRPYLMRYLHANDPNFEPVLRDLLDFEHIFYDEMTKNEGDLSRGGRSVHTWERVFAALEGILTPIQIQQLVSRLEQDFKSVCEHLNEMAEAQKLLEHDHGGAG